MSKKETETIIIGGGMAGIGCARKLAENGYKNFQVITENVGGRILMSDDGETPYGAYFIGSDYKHIGGFFQKERRIGYFDMSFHYNGKAYRTFSCLRYPIQLLRTLFIIQKFIRHYKKLNKKCENVSQKDAIMSDKYIKELYFTKASDFVKRHGIKKINDLFLGQYIQGCLFGEIEKISAFEYLKWVRYAVLPLYEFDFLKHKFTSGIDNFIEKDTVTSINKGKNNDWLLKTKNRGELTCKNLVVATPPYVSKELLKIKEIKEGAYAYMFHINGELKKQWGKKSFNVFKEGSDKFDIARQPDNTYLFYCVNPNPDLLKYFNNPFIIAKKHWAPAFNIFGHELWDCNIDKNLYLIGDHNIGGLEESYITGIFAANQILNTKNKY